MTTVFNHEAQVREFYRALAQAWGPQHWWPARTRFEVIIGAFLTQNTAWVNVERALANLRRARMLTVAGVRQASVAELEQMVRPAGYYRQKARRLNTFVAFLDKRYGGSLNRMFARPTPELRHDLLGLNGVGPETADSILLYAGKHPVFVVDAYTRRIVERHGILPATADYEEIRQLFERALVEMEPGDQPNSFEHEGRWERDGRKQRRERHHNPQRAIRSPGRVQALNEMHALIVEVGKRHCYRAAASCQGCPLQVFLPKVRG